VTFYFITVIVLCELL